MKRPEISLSSVLVHWQKFTGMMLESWHLNSCFKSRCALTSCSWLKFNSMVLYFHLEEIHVDTYPVTSFFSSTGQTVSFSGPLLEHTWQRFIGRGHRCGAVKMASSGWCVLLIRWYWFYHTKFYPIFDVLADSGFVPGQTDWLFSWWEIFGHIQQPRAQQS